MDQTLLERFAQWEQQGRIRETRITDYGAGPLLFFNQQQYINVSSGNYMGMANHPMLIAAARNAIEQYGLSSGGSPLICGYSGVQDIISRRLAEFIGTEASLVVSSGYLAGTAVIPALMETGDVIFSDSLNHASLIDASRLSKAHVEIYRHVDMDYLHNRLATVPARRRMIITDGVFSMDGDVAPIEALLSLADTYDAWLMVDDSHGLGVLGRRGGGTIQHYQVQSPRLIIAASLSKGIGVHGGVIAASADVIRYLTTTARPWIFSSALPPAWCVAGTISLDILAQSDDKRHKLWDYSRRFRQELLNLGYETMATPVPEVPIIPLIVGSENRALSVAEHLKTRHIWASAIRPPTVPKDSSRIRFALMSDHTDQQIAHVLDSLRTMKSQPKGWR